MRKQIAAANWKMNLNQQEAQDLLKNILDKLRKYWLKRNCVT